MAKLKKTSELTSVLEGTVETNCATQILDVRLQQSICPESATGLTFSTQLLAQGYGSSLRVKWLVVDTAG